MLRAAEYANTANRTVAAKAGTLALQRLPSRVRRRTTGLKPVRPPVEAAVAATTPFPMLIPCFLRCQSVVPPGGTVFRRLLCSDWGRASIRRIYSFIFLSSQHFSASWAWLLRFPVAASRYCRVSVCSICKKTATGYSVLGREKRLQLQIEKNLWMFDSKKDGWRLGAPGVYATYATGFFSLSLVPMTSLVVPLWALSIGAAPSMIGIIVASRAVLPFLLSIHGGAMMDRLGTRRMLIFFASLGACFSLLYPLSTWVGALIALQLIVGWAQGMGWIGAQIKIAKVAAGGAVHAGRFSFYATCGTFLGPLVAGLAWDLLGPWGAFSIIALWGSGLLAASFALPKSIEPNPRQLRVSEFCPNFADYLRAFALMSIPAVAFIVSATFLRISAVSIQSSFYNVYLQSIGLSGTLIGILVSFESLIGGPAALLSGLAIKRVSPPWVLLLSIGIAIAAISITPLMETVFPLMVAAGIYGVGIGMGFPLLLSILSSATDAGQHGLSVGLRTTANRLASIVIPIVMGFVVEAVGIKLGFLVMGTILLFILGAVAWQVHRTGLRKRSL